MIINRRSNDYNKWLKSILIWKSWDKWITQKLDKITKLLWEQRKLLHSNQRQQSYISTNPK